MRVGEITRLNISDMNFQERSCIVLDKGNSEREVYLTTKSKMYIKKYLQTRTDDNEALFVSLIKPYNRLGISGVEILIRNLGKEANIKCILINLEEQWQLWQQIKVFPQRKYKNYQVISKSILQWNMRW